MLFFSYSMLLASWKPILAWILVGVGVYGVARAQGAHRGVDFEAILRRDVEEG
jgi:hypothetical protein